MKYATAIATISTIAMTASAAVIPVEQAWANTTTTITTTTSATETAATVPASTETAANPSLEEIYKSCPEMANLHSDPCPSDRRAGSYNNVCWENWQKKWCNGGKGPLDITTDATTTETNPTPKDTTKTTGELIAQFVTFPADDCRTNSNKYAVSRVSVLKGEESSVCKPLVAGVHSVSQVFGNLKCQLVVYTTDTCADPGQQVGAPQGPGAAAGCQSDAGGFKAYKVTCPWW